MNLTPEAQSALLNSPARQGAAIPLATKPEVIRELLGAGLVTRTHNLTRQGTIQRARIMDARLDEAFA